MVAKIENINEFISGLKEIGYDFMEIKEDALSTAPAGLSIDTGVAYEGALAEHTILTFNIAKRLCKMFASSMPVNEESLKKVCFLHQISKAQMFTKNTNSWEVEKRGMVYAFTQTPGVLKAGERSIMIAMNSGIKFTADEFEAMRILDKTGDEFDAQEPRLSALSIILRNANKFAYDIERIKANSQEA